MTRTPHSRKGNLGRLKIAFQFNITFVDHCGWVRLWAEQGSAPHREAWCLPLESPDITEDRSLEQNFGSGDVEWKPREGKKFAPGHTAAPGRRQARARIFAASPWLVSQPQDTSSA